MKIGDKIGIIYFDFNNIQERHIGRIKNIIKTSTGDVLSILIPFLGRIIEIKKKTLIDYKGTPTLIIKSDLYKN